MKLYYLLRNEEFFEASCLYPEAKNIMERERLCSMCIDDTSFSRFSFAP